MCRKYTIWLGTGWSTYCCVVYKCRSHGNRNHVISKRGCVGVCGYLSWPLVYLWPWYKFCPSIVSINNWFPAFRSSFAYQGSGFRGQRKLTGLFAPLHPDGTPSIEYQDPSYVLGVGAVLCGHLFCLPYKHAHGLYSNNKKLKPCDHATVCLLLCSDSRFWNANEYVFQPHPLYAKQASIIGNNLC